MKKLLFAIVALFVFNVHGQGFMVVSEAETEDIPVFSTVMNHWMGAVKKTMEMDDARMRVFRQMGTRKLHMLQWFDSLSEMATHMETQEARRDKIMENVQANPMPDGTWDQFTASTTFNESAVWKYRPDLSTTPETFSPLSQEERDKITYRRVQYMKVEVGQDGAFEEWRKKSNELDKKLGISFHVAVFESVFGTNGANYIVILLDTSRFDYHKNWQERMEKRGASEEWNNMANSGNNMGKWTVVKEENWNQISDLTF